ncbi:MAG: hypothetical protein ABSF67_10375, partial [Roseiarcus sp.]
CSDDIFGLGQVLKMRTCSVADAVLAVRPLQSIVFATDEIRELIRRQVAPTEKPTQELDGDNNFAAAESCSDRGLHRCRKVTPPQLVFATALLLLRPTS